MTPPDDLNVGDWVALYRTEPEASGAQRVVTGQPLMIIAINLPWIAVSNGLVRQAFDLRFNEVQRLHSTEYIDLMRADDNGGEMVGLQYLCGHEKTGRPSGQPSESTIQTRELPTVPQLDHCPQCSTGLVWSKDANEWEAGCDCGFHALIILEPKNG